MASTTLSILTPTVLGAVITAKTGVASSESITISPTTAQSAIDTSTLFIRITAVGGSVTPTISAGNSQWSSSGQGSKALTAIASSASAVIGGQDFESARFKSTAGDIVITFAGTGTASIEAFQAPGASE